MKIYKIERSGTGSYRFRSCYNGAKGKWRDDEESAIADGEFHQDIIEMLYEIKF